MVSIGCQGYLAARSMPVTFIEEVLREIKAAETRPIKLSESHRAELFRSLHGPVRKIFLSDDYLPEVWASWWYERDKVTFVRYAKDGSRWAFVSYLADGRQFGSGGGTTGPEPWTK